MLLSQILDCVSATTCLSAAQRARRQLGALSLLRFESTVCFQRKLSS
ncbi:hypothetical protein GK677_01440 [Bifidobacteriaceae bacterium NR044]|nr:hypothetical protein [Bifidobacteriaceae bacterium NR043]MBF9353440.1 hypothetical protein [Bifidobacteriaceae bacterium NR044]